MKKLLICMFVCLLAMPLYACLATDAPKASEPQSTPDIESIVEPVAEAETPTEARDEDEPEISDFSDEDMQAFESEPLESAISIFEAPALTESEPALNQDEISQYKSLSEIFESLLPDMTLDSGRIERELLRLINALRAEKSVNALGIEDNLRFAARIRAAEAFESFSHTRPDGTPYNTAFDEAGFPYEGKWHGENLSSLSLASGTLSEEEIALKMFNGLKSSPGHYRNMTEENFVQAGIGVAVTYTDEGVAVTSAQMFAGL